MTVGEQTLSPELLADYDILILPASSGTVEYLPEEIEAIKTTWRQGVACCSAILDTPPVPRPLSC